MEKKKFNVLVWDFNRDTVEPYDVLPYLRDCYRERKKKSKRKYAQNSEWFKLPVTKEDFKTFVEKESMYRYWARCEYEMILHGWPAQKNDYKLDVHKQIMMNIDLVAEILFQEFSKKKAPKKEDKA